MNFNKRRKLSEDDEETTKIRRLRNSLQTTPANKQASNNKKSSFMSSPHSVSFFLSFSLKYFLAFVIFIGLDYERL
jgi:hypothetical protein